MYGLADILEQYKTHVWGHVEYDAGAIFHACDTTLARLDGIQSHVLNELDLASDKAFLDYNFAPTRLRRAIGLLGFIHKRVLGTCHPGIAKLLPFSGITVYHNKQMRAPSPMTHRSISFNRSLFGLLQIYNMLPQFAVDCTSVKSFQTMLTRFVRRRCADGDPEWASSYDTCDAIWQLRLWMEE